MYTLLAVWSCVIPLLPVNLIPSSYPCRGIFSISDNFRIVGLAEQSGSPQVDLQSDPEFASMFLFHNVEPLGMEGEREVILSKVCLLQILPVLE